MKRHAVFLRGNLRTWNYIKNDIIKFFDVYHEQPDWYVCFWNSDTSTIAEIKNDFKNSNLKFLKFETDHNYQRFDSRILEGAHTRGPDKKIAEFLGIFSKVVYPYWRLAYLDQILSMAKRKYEIENNINYQSVVFARPDISYSTTSDLEDYVRCINELHSMEITNTKSSNLRMGKFSEGCKYDNYVSPDTLLVTGNIASDIFSTRFIDIDFTDGSLTRLMNWDVHQLISMIKTKYQLFELADTEPNYRVSLLLDIIRPDNLSMDEWNSMSKKSKYELCVSLGIDPYDYNLTIK